MNLKSKIFLLLTFSICFIFIYMTGQYLHEQSHQTINKYYNCNSTIKMFNDDFRAKTIPINCSVDKELYSSYLLSHSNNEIDYECYRFDGYIYMIIVILLMILFKD